MPLEKTQRSLYVGNLAPSVNDQLLWEIFSIVGPVEVAKVIKDKVTQQNAGFGFVDYYSPEVAAFAQEKLNGKKIFDFEMKVNWAAAQGTREEGAMQHHIFVGDLSPEVDDAALFNAFSAFGAVSEARITRDPVGNKSKGYGFVSFKNRDDADRAVREMNGEWLGGRAIRCNWANSKARATLGGPGGGMAPTPGPSITAADVAAIAAQSSSSNTSVYVGNLAPDANEQALQIMFAEFGPIDQIRLQTDKGFAFIIYTSHDAAARAIAGCNGKMIGSRPIRCSWGKEQMPAMPFPGMPPMGQFPAF